MNRWYNASVLDWRVESMSLYEMLEKKVDELSDELKVLHDRAEIVERDVMAYQVALETEARSKGMPNAVIAKVAENGHRGAKTDFVKDLVTKYAGEGVTPKQIKEE